MADGLRLAQESKEKTGNAAKDRAGLIELHGAALEVLVAQKKEKAALAPHLDALKNMHDSYAKALADIQEAAVSIRRRKTPHKSASHA